ncbi:MAG: LptF/LptG family permease [Candidatus Poribacteria bacterium]|nr:LptF/LptG family permease [Candidatus Poribacteria bacterium]
MRLIIRYVAAEFLLYFSLMLSASTTVLILRQVFLLTRQFVQKDVSLWHMAELVLYALPSVLALTMPISVLAGMLMALGQLSFSGEITAMKASGIGVHQLAPFALGMGLLFFAADFCVMEFALPWGNRQFSHLRWEISRRYPTLILTEGSVMRTFEREKILWMYERDNLETGRLENVRVWQSYETGIPTFSVAEEGAVETVNGRSVLALYNGSTYEPGDKDQPETAAWRKFDRQAIYLPMEDETRGTTFRSTSFRAMRMGDILSEVEKLEKRLIESPSDYTSVYLRSSIYKAWVEWHKKLSIPFACLAFALLSVPIGALTRRSGFMAGLVIGLPLIIVYYVMLRAGEDIGILLGASQDGGGSLLGPLFESAWLGAGLGVWLPNIPPLAMGIYLTIRMARR